MGEEERQCTSCEAYGLMGLLTMGNTALLYFWIALGSALGGVARYWCTGVAARMFGETFPWGTLLVNVVGSFIIGFFATLTGPRRPHLRRHDHAPIRHDRDLLGGFTTFSSFSLQTLNLANDGEWLQAGGNIVGLGRALPRGRLAGAHARRFHQRHEVDLTMPLSRDAVLLRIFIGEDDKAGHRPLYEAIVLKAREMGLAGATVLRGPMGFGHSSHLHTTKILRLSQDLPLVIEIVDNEEKIKNSSPPSSRSWAARWSPPRRSR